MAKVKHSFEDFNFNKQILLAIEAAGFSVPTEIQQKAIPPIIAGQDVVGIAQTGTGKTASFVLPLVKKLAYAQGNAPRALVFAPTRELVMQLAEHFKILASNTDLRSCTLYGGVGARDQIACVNAGVDVLFCTPGRFMDIYKKGEIELKYVKTMVLDEADKMMDMGFMPQIRSILEVVPRKRQNLLFSATFPDKVEDLSHEFLDFPTRIEVTPQSTPVQSVEQRLYHVPNLRTKIALLEYLLENDKSTKRVMVFTRKRTTAENVYKFLDRKLRDEVRVVHANKGQNTRINSMKAFGEGSVRVLVATDVSSRGIDIEQVSHVVNLEVPVIYEDYVHRIGRTGRATQTGVAITFADKSERLHIEKIEQVIKMQIPRLEMPQAVKVYETSFEEAQQMDREIDRIKKKEDPDYQGAFHEKKRKPTSDQKKSGRSKSRRKKRR